MYSYNLKIWQLSELWLKINSIEFQKIYIIKHTIFVLYITFQFDWKSISVKRMLFFCFFFKYSTENVEQYPINNVLLEVLVANF